MLVDQGPAVAGGKAPARGGGRAGPHRRPQDRWRGAVVRVAWKPQGGTVPVLERDDQAGGLQLELLPAEERVRARRSVRVHHQEERHAGGVVRVPAADERHKCVGIGIDLVQNVWVVMSAVGLYGSMGEAAVKACVANGTNYGGIASELDFVKEMRRKFSARDRIDALLIRGVQLRPIGDLRVRGSGGSEQRQRWRRRRRSRGAVSKRAWDADSNGGAM